MTENQVAELLERATADLRPSTDLVAAGIADGRRRHRRRLALAAAGTLAAAAVVGGAVSLSPRNGSAPGPDFVADHPSTTTSSYAAQPSAPSSALEQFHRDPFPVAPDAMASTLATLLTGTVTNPVDNQFPLDHWQSGAVDLDGASVQVTYQHSTGPRCDGDLNRGDTSCTDLGGGYFLATYSAEIFSKGVGNTGVRDVGVTYYTPDGYKINATASNASGGDPTKPVMADPVLGTDELTAIAESPAWR